MAVLSTPAASSNRFCCFSSRARLLAAAASVGSSATAFCSASMATDVWPCWCASMPCRDSSRACSGGRTGSGSACLETGALAAHPASMGQPTRTTAVAAPILNSGLVGTLPGPSPSSQFPLVTARMHTCQRFQAAGDPLVIALPGNALMITGMQCHGPLFQREGFFLQQHLVLHGFHIVQFGRHL